MVKTQRSESFTRKIDDLRKRLVEDLPLQELQRMQVQIDLLERVASPELDYHHHDTNEHHDHQTRTLEDIVGERISRVAK